jgi:hypothetical protein
MRVVEIKQTIRKETTHIFEPSDEVIIAIPKRGTNSRRREDEND